MAEVQRERARRLRTVVLLVVFLVGLGLLLTRCPSNRDGMPGQLAQSMDETVTSARSAALAIDLWLQHRSTNQLTSVQISDARDEIVKAYKGIAELKAEDPVDVGRQRMLTQSMTDIIAQLNAASATLRTISTEPKLDSVRASLTASADALESGYR
jgi:hypothetical protein